MKASFATALALAGLFTLAACSASGSASTSTSTDSGTSSAADADSTSSATDTSTSPAASSQVYPGATATDKSSYGTPPPGGKLYVTSDDPVTVAKWYVTNAGAQATAPATAKGGLLLIGDQNTGTFVTLIGENGKTYIQLLPVSAAK